MTTPPLQGTPVNNVNFLDANPVTTLDFFFSLSLSQSNAMCFFLQEVNYMCPLNSEGFPDR